MSTRRKRGVLAGAVPALCVTALLAAAPAPHLRTSGPTALATGSAIGPQRLAGNSPVADAAMRGETDAVRSLVQRGADVNASQGDGMTALHWAGRQGNLEMADILLRAGANPEAVTRLGGYTALHLASQAGQWAVVDRLLEGGSDANAATTTGAATSLHFAAASGSAETIAVLLDHGADVNARESEWEQTPLMFAAALNRVDAVDALLQGGADAAIAAKVVDVPAREEEDRADQRRRSQRRAALEAASREGGGRQAAARGQAGPQQARQQGPSRGQAARGEQRDQQPPDEPQGPTGFSRQEQLRGTTEIDPLSYSDLVGTHGGLTALLLAAREGHVETVEALLEAGADIDQGSAGDRTPPILMAAINGHFDVTLFLLERGADPAIASDAGATPLYGVLNAHWIPKTRHPQPTDYRQQKVSYLELMEALLEAGADANARLTRPLWYTTYNNDLLNVERTGATPFWRAAYALDIDAMRLLVAHGADPSTPTTKAPSRRFGRGGDRPDPSGLPPVPIGGPAVYPIHAASGAGYGQGYAANAHRHVPDGWLQGVKYLVEELGADVNARDHNGYNAVHHAAARGDNELILYLVDKGADVTAVSRRGQTTVDMANGPVQRIQPFPETIKLLESLGAKNNHNCVSC